MWIRLHICSSRCRLEEKKRKEKNVKEANHNPIKAKQIKSKKAPRLSPLVYAAM